MSAAPDGGVVVVTVPGLDPGAAWADGLRAAGLAVRYEPREAERAAGETARILAGAAAAILSTDPVDRATLQGLPGLRVLARTGVGFDAIDVAAAAELGIPVITTPGQNERSVADHTLALILAALRRVASDDAAVRAGRWDRAGAHLGWELTGATVGIVGYGAIGRLVARRLAGFDVRLLAHDVVPVEGVEQVELDALLARSDVVTLHVPLTPAPRGLIGERELALLGPGGVLVNTSRGGVVDEEALARALAAGRLRAAALDVFDQEPPAGTPLAGLPNCVLTPHAAGLSVGAMAGMLDVAVASVVAVLEGREPPGRIVNAPLARSLRP
jgi:phosphoglycerate dehydrogenase-like enzyme